MNDIQMLRGSVGGFPCCCEPATKQLPWSIIQRGSQSISSSNESVKDAGGRKTLVDDIKKAVR